MHLSKPKKDIRIVLLEGIHPKAADILKEDGYTNIALYDEALTGVDLEKALKGAHIVGIRSRTQLSEGVLAKCPKLMAIGCFCIGTNQVDGQAAALRGIPVFNAPFSNTRSVSEMVVGQIIMLMRRIPEKNAALHRDGTWLKTAKDAYEVRGKTLGIVGYGHIGMQTSLAAEALGMQIIYYDIENKLSLGNARAVGTLSKLLKQADVVTMHVPSTELTKNMIGKKEFAAMKKGVRFLNLSRGDVVDVDALEAALKSGHVSGAAVDVFPTEPKKAQEALSTPLRGFDNVILTPHIGGSTKEAQENIGAEVAHKLIKYSNNGSTVSAANFVEVSLPKHEGQHRIMHIHHNKPGILSAINRVFSQENINITGQYLQTNAHIGYVVTDVQETHGHKVPLKAMQSIDGTIRTRILY